MDDEKIEGIIEAILFAAGREVKINELMSALELGSEEIINYVAKLGQKYKNKDRGIEIIKIEDAY